ncbi:hypothetical protein HanRHA438_Chr07g0306631 [Helianthus annuus]|nr:hypothetical protein HanIR_Chr07g0319911 [Helianthus annuus]KAJ0729836.1 hypothetical protein HanLR1_Chr07g0257391 [Helianthus annuus]KAJ0908098.1 hypothetical protein HanRHA438_Chr07g0306631 [Helianthus annuus]
MIHAYTMLCIAFLVIERTGRCNIPHLPFKTPNALSTSFLADSCNFLNAFSFASTGNEGAFTKTDQDG